MTGGLGVGDRGVKGSSASDSLPVPMQGQMIDPWLGPLRLDWSKSQCR